MLQTAMQRKVLMVGLLYALCLFFSFYFEFFYLALIPALGMVVIMTIFRMHWTFYMIALVTPLSIDLSELDIDGIGLIIPTELLLMGLFLLALWQFALGRKLYFKHPLLWWVAIYFSWMLITTMTSEDPLVSFKYIIARAWYIVPCFLLLVPLFEKRIAPEKMYRLYFMTLILAIVYTIIRHSMHGFDKDSAHWVMEPLFKDHTVYGAALALVFPFVVLQLFSKRHNPLLRFFYITGSLILTIGLILSYTRAAWLSVVFAAGVGVLMLMKVPFKWMLFSGLVIGSLTTVYWDDIQISLNRNKKESSDKMDDHIKSISNVSSDASNLERLNRWNCAMAMFDERPIVGWGPGMYQFVYAPFQRAQDKTIISTNRGDGGNAHSEFLGPLSEQGLVGMLVYIAFVLLVMFMGFRVFRGTSDYEERLVVMGLFLGIVTYFAHGFLNNFLDSDKIAVPFWVAVSYLVYRDTRVRQEIL
jgi:putative inorganic carbon (HCO3(-)) transporter